MLNSIQTKLANRAWYLACRRGHQQFQRASTQARQVQTKILTRLLQANASTAYGRTHHFDRIRTVQDFQARIPVVAYEDLAPWIERIENGEQGALTAEPVLAFEETSGSSSASKLIPYTRSLRAEFGGAVAAWIYDLYGNIPGLLNGSSYWSITPLTRQRRKTAGGIPIGFESDTEYFGRTERLLLNRILTVPDSVASIAQIEQSLYVTCRFLLQDPDLAFISIWNPTFLGSLMRVMDEHSERLCRDLRDGTVRPPAPLTPELSERLSKRLERNPGRARFLNEERKRHGALLPQALWPKLKVISCWKDAAAANAIPALQRQFPLVMIQGKGLLATEGVISIPLVGQAGAALALHSHFYEFLASGEKTPLLAHELAEGEEYSVIITTGGGLWRYQLGDCVRVVGFYRDAPLLEFLGREDGVSDLCGEKLNPVFVGEVIRQWSQAHSWEGDFAMLAPVIQNNPQSYALFINGRFTVQRAVDSLDRLLCSNPHYRYCRELQQLGSPSIYIVTANASEAYLRRCEQLGQRTGNIKPTALHKHAGWEMHFAGKRIARTTVHRETECVS